jgi:hypothetical protein
LRWSPSTTGSEAAADHGARGRGRLGSGARGRGRLGSGARTRGHYAGGLGDGRRQPHDGFGAAPAWSHGTQAPKACAADADRIWPLRPVATEMFGAVLSPAWLVPPAPTTSTTPTAEAAPWHMHSQVVRMTSLWCAAPLAGTPAPRALHLHQHSMGSARAAGLPMTSHPTRGTTCPRCRHSLGAEGPQDRAPYKKYPYMILGCDCDEPVKTPNPPGATWRLGAHELLAGADSERRPLPGGAGRRGGRTAGLFHLIDWNPRFPTWIHLRLASLACLRRAGHPLHGHLKQAPAHVHQDSH